MRKIGLVVLLLAGIAATGCDLLFAGEEGSSIKQLKKEKGELALQVERLTRENGKLRDENTVQKVMIGLFSLRFATERYASLHRGAYPEANGLGELQGLVTQNLPKDFQLDTAYLETIRSSEKGYIFIANVRGQKIVVSNLI